MPFNIDKCKVKHIGSRNCNHSYQMQGKLLKTETKESDLGVTISNDLKSTKHCRTASKRANTMLGFIAKKYKTPEVMLSLYSFWVRPHF